MEGAKVLLCNVAVRQSAASFPPVACTSLYNALSRAGYQPEFLDIDALRPAKEELLRFFEKGQFDIVGISAVISTGYKYTKELAALIKSVSPDTKIILGGNLAAAYEVVLNRCKVDLCVIGEGEEAIVQLSRHWDRHRSFSPNDELSRIKGIAFLGPEGKYVLTGRPELLEPEEIELPDYELLGRYRLLDRYLTDPLSEPGFFHDGRSHQQERRGRKMAVLFTEKGCINRCTFCHRWIGGYRLIPVQKVIAIMKELIAKHNVGFFFLSDECFGENRGWVDEFIAAVKPLEILFLVGGARVSIIRKDPQMIKRLKDAGLSAIYFGIESGSDKILKMMNKNATRDENLQATKICAQAGVFTTIQLVIGMPGENEHTVGETIDFVNRATGSLPFMPEVSINYLQALPGTPCYEYLRRRGFLGQTLNSEEEYLLKVSDVNAAEFRHYINISEEPLSKVKLWKARLVIACRINWLKNHNWVFPAPALAGQAKAGIGARFKNLIKYSAVTYRAIDLMGALFWSVMLFKERCALYGAPRAVLLALKLAKEEDRSGFIQEKPFYEKLVPLQLS